MGQSPDAAAETPVPAKASATAKVSTPAKAAAPAPVIPDVPPRIIPPPSPSPRAGARRPAEAPAAAQSPPARNKQRRPVKEQTYPADATFGSLPVEGRVARSLNEMGYTQPTPIQEQVVPLVRGGRDLVGQAQTGTGKTAAFGIPLVEKVDPSVRKLQALVLTPTRELAKQVSGELSRLGKYRGVQPVTVYGGQAMSRQLTALEQGVQVVVATPGRLMDHMSRGTIDLGGVSIVVLDEADQMLDIGFAEDIEYILRYTPRDRQTLLFSATMPGPIRGLARRYLRNPEWVRTGGEAEPVEQVEQVYYEVATEDRTPLLCELMQKAGDVTQGLIFRRTKIGVDRLVADLRRRRLDAEAIHGDMSQGQREAVMGRFRAGRLCILVATNVAARGLDIPAVSHVVNYDMPSNLEEYVHRIGRTARMGRPGTAITFVSEWDFDMLDLIQSHIGEDLQPGVWPHESRGADNAPATGTQPAAV